MTTEQEEGSVLGLETTEVEVSADQELFGEVLDQIEDTINTIQEILDHHSEILERIESFDDADDFICLISAINKVIREATNKIIIPLTECEYSDLHHIMINGEEATVQELADFADEIDDYLLGEFNELKDKVETAINAMMEVED